MTSIYKESSMTTSEEKSKRWKRYGKVGQLTYGKRAAESLSVDPLLSPELRAEAKTVAEAITQLSHKYSLALKGT
jgi:hypothetical protein